MINGREYRLLETQLFSNYIKFEVLAEPGYFDIPSDEDMIAVETWCLNHGCGRRSGWDKFYFETDEQATMFKLRWA